MLNVNVLNYVPFDCYSDVSVLQVTSSPPQPTQLSTLPAQPAASPREYASDLDREIASINIMQNKQDDNKQLGRPILGAGARRQNGSDKKQNQSPRWKYNDKDRGRNVQNTD